MTVPSITPSVTETFRTPAGPLAYTDMGDGPAVVFLHGNPTNARLYRHLIQNLAADHRCIAPDYLGFGRSAAPSSFSYRPAAHATLIERLLRHLDLDTCTLVLHDWGGPIGMAYALRHPTTVQRLILLNTWAWPLDHRPLLQFVSRLLDTRPGRLSIERLNAFARFVMPCTVGPSEPLWPDWIAAYATALDSPQRRHACWALARALHREAPWLRALWSHRTDLSKRPTLLCWGMADPAFGTEACLQHWRSFAPSAEVHRFYDVGHYVPEELGPALAPVVRDFLDSTA